MLFGWIFTLFTSIEVLTQCRYLIP